MRPPIHVLVLPSWYPTPEVPWSGTFFENQAVALAGAGARVGVVFVEQRSLRSLTPSKLTESHFQIVCSAERGVTTLRMRGWNTLGQTAAGARIWCALSERLVMTYIRRFGVPDVVHAHAALWAGRVAVNIGQKLSRPSVVTEHSGSVLQGRLRPFEQREGARVYREVDAVLAVSERLLTVVGSMAPVRRGKVIPNTIDFDFFTLPTLPRRQTPFTFVSVCSLVRGKRIDRLIRAFAKVCQVWANVRLIVVGGGVEAQNLHRLAEQCGVTAQIEFTGPLSQRGVRDRLWSANAFVLPSESETFGVALVEALATGIPVIATRCGGPEEIINGHLGSLVERENDDSLAEAMIRMKGRVSEEAMLRDCALKRFSFASVANELIDLYSALGMTASRRI